MLGSALKNQLDDLTPAELVELRDVIQARIDDIESDEVNNLLTRRVAEADAAPRDYLSLEEWKARRRSSQSA
ncbi:hypothetical protein ACFSWE_10245 [Leucobacter albus]|uniref:Addiction module component n=1 Tax=Leucobacter albus TaxID=272210 RepID=A0ABW3TLW7_9MICO